MHTKLNKSILLASILLGLPYLVDYAHARQKPENDCEVRHIGEATPAGPSNGVSPKEDISTKIEASLPKNQVTIDTSTTLRAGSWRGRFKFFPGQDQPGHYEQVIDVACDTNSNCTAQKSFLIEGKEVAEPPIFDGSNPTPIPKRLPFNIDKMITMVFRRSVLDLASASDFPHAAPYFEPEIYRRIGTPNHVVECRASILVMICKLDKPLVRDDYGSLTAWVILFPDMSSGPGCPGYGCPHALTREDPK
jgi:hypothetical protein